MTFTQSIETCLTKYAVFEGRARPSEFWWFWLFVAVVNNVLFYAPAIPSLVYIVTVLGFLIPTLAAGVRRLHDTGRSGWWWLVPIANIVFLARRSEDGANRYGEAPASLL